MFKNKHFINTPNLIHNPKYFCLFYFQLHVFSNTRILNVLPFNSNDSLANVLTKLLLNCKKKCWNHFKSMWCNNIKSKNVEDFQVLRSKVAPVYIVSTSNTSLYIEIYIKIWMVEDMYKEFDGIFYVFIWTTFIFSEFTWYLYWRNVFNRIWVMIVEFCIAPYYDTWSTTYFIV